MSKKRIPRVSKSFKKKYPVANTFIAATAVIAVWRGLWGLMDLYLLPDNPTWSFVVSIVLGVIILLVDDFRLDELH